MTSSVVGLLVDSKVVDEIDEVKVDVTDGDLDCIVVNVRTEIGGKVVRKVGDAVVNDGI